MEQRHRPTQMRPAGLAAVVSIRFVFNLPIFCSSLSLPTNS